MQLALIGLVLAAIVLVVSGGHRLFLSPLWVLPLGRLFGHRRRYGRL